MDKLSCRGFYMKFLVLIAQCRHIAAKYLQETRAPRNNFHLTLMHVFKKVLRNNFYLTLVHVFKKVLRREAVPVRKMMDAASPWWADIWARCVSLRRKKSITRADIYMRDMVTDFREDPMKHYCPACKIDAETMMSDACQNCKPGMYK